MLILNRVWQRVNQIIRSIFWLLILSAIICGHGLQEKSLLKIPLIICINFGLKKTRISAAPTRWDIFSKDGCEKIIVNLMRIKQKIFTTKQWSMNLKYSITFQKHTSDYFWCNFEWCLKQTLNLLKFWF